MTNLNITYWKTDRLAPYARHIKKFSREALNKMIAAINEYGFRLPILATGEGVVVDGHLRLAAALKLKLESIPVIVTDGMSDGQLRRFRLAINRSAFWADWLDENLALEMADLLEAGEDLTLTGFIDPAAK